MRVVVTNQPFMDSGFLFDASVKMLGREDWALAVGGFRVKGKGLSLIHI